MLLKIKELLDIKKYFSNNDLSKDSISNINYQKPDTSSFNKNASTLYIDTLAYIVDDSSNFEYSENNNEDIVITDKLLFYKNIKVKGLDEISSNKLALLDSLLMNETNRKTDLLMVEFWESPLNYKGYKLSDNKLILFGIKESEFASLEIINKILYLRYLNSLYSLEYTTDFKPLVISDLKQTKLK